MYIWWHTSTSRIKNSACAQHLGQLNDLPALVGLTLPGGERWYGDTQSFPGHRCGHPCQGLDLTSHSYGHPKKLTPSAMTLYNDTQWLIFHFQMADGFICFFGWYLGKSESGILHFKNQHQNVAVVIAMGHNHRPSHGYRGHHQWVAAEAELRRQQRRPDKPTIPYLYLHVQHFCIMQSD